MVVGVVLEKAGLLWKENWELELEKWRKWTKAVGLARLYNR